MLLHAEKFGPTWTVMPGTFDAINGSAGNVSITGGDRIHFLSNTGALISSGVTSQSKFIINVKYNLESLPSGSNPGFPSNAIPIFYVQDAGTYQCGLFVRSDGKLQFFSGSTAIGSASLTALTVDVGASKYDIEAEINLGSSAAVKCWINGNLEINATGDTTVTANNTADSVVIRQNGSGSCTITSISNYYHVVIMDGVDDGDGLNTNLGVVQVNAHIPTADGDHTAWTANTGTRFGAVDDAAPNGDTDYVSHATVGGKVSFPLSDLPPGITHIKGTMGWVNAARSDDVTKGFKALLRNGTTDALGSTEKFPSITYGYHRQRFGKSPFSGVAWTVAEWNATQGGAEITT